ncbi:MAG: methyltransferase domain-containing protein [Thaumarchaeota archaeon]|nr:methyltransferase domain-containing protein [Nitrososphaerota archaeon]
MTIQIQKRILNAGCGNDSYGTDRIDLHATPATTKVCDMELGLPFEAEIFDEVLSRQSIEHMRNPGRLLEEFHRVLKRGGLLTLTTDNARYWRYLFRAKVYHGATDDDQHFGIYWPYHIENHLKRAGFEVESSGFANYFGHRVKKVDTLLLMAGWDAVALPRIQVVGRKP